MRCIWLLAGILCLSYYGVIAAYAGPDADFSWFWIALGIVFLLFCGRDRLAALHPELFPVLLHRIAVVFLLAILGIMTAVIIPVSSGMHLQDPENVTYVIVLGAQVRNTEPSRALLRRLEKALAFAKKEPSCVLILSGGKGAGEQITEAECMRRYLTEHGIPEDRLVLEEQSTTTEENLIFSDRLTGCSKEPCGILSNDFHVYRALKIAQDLGYTDAKGIDAEGDPVMELHYVVRESAALIARSVFGKGGLK